MAQSPCFSESPMSVNGEKESNVETMVQEADFIVGSCSNRSDRLPNSQLMVSTTKMGDIPTLNNSAYEACIRLITRQLRQSSKVNEDLQDDHFTADEIHSVKSTDDDWKELYVKTSQGIPELLTLQNAVIQLQLAFNLIQQEANTAIRDTSVATQRSQYWQREYHEVKQTASSLEQENLKLRQQNEILISDKRRLKAACKKLRTQQHAVQSQQVESYVISALSTHEQFLTGSVNNASCNGKNRSRTTTLDTTGFDDFTTLDDPFVNNSPHNSSTIESASSDSTVSNSPKATSEAFEENSTEISAIASTTLPTEVTMKDHNQQQQKEISSQNNKGMNGFDHACHAFGRTFKFIDNHVHKKEQQQQHPHASPTNALKRTMNHDGVITGKIPVIETTNSPLKDSRPYAPIRFDAITPTHSEDSQDSKGYRRKLHPPLVNKPLIDANALLHGQKDDCTTSDQELLSIPILNPYLDNGNMNCVSNPGSLKSESPLSIPEEETLYSDPRIQCQRYSCDPSLLRSLSIPTIATPQQRSTVPHLTASKQLT